MLFLNSALPAFGQSLSGLVINENKEPIPYVNIFIRELNSGTSTDQHGKYFLNLTPGPYEVVLSSIGYESLLVKVFVGDQPTIKNFVLKSAAQELDQVVIKASKRDPAYEIIQKAIDHRDDFFIQIRSFTSKVYTKATEIEDKKSKYKKKHSEPAPSVELNHTGLPTDPFESKKEDRYKHINMVEIKSILHYEAPDNFKEKRTGYKLYGTKAGLYLPNFSETDFNFYQNLVEMRGLAEAPIISPLSRTSILAYKFILEKSTEENGVIVHKIKVVPRKASNSTFMGYIYINDSIWNINRLNLSINKGGLKIYDQLTIKQNYNRLSDGTWIPYRLEFDYFTKEGKLKSFEGNTLIYYSDFQKNISFPPKFFGNEVALTTKEAYTRDSTFWQTQRPEPLTLDQKKVVEYRDSIQAAHNDKDYLDSIEARYNKITVGDILYDGIGKRNTEKKRDLYFSSLLNLIEFEVIGGWRFGPYVSLFKRWESGRLLWTNGSFNIGVKNADVQGSYHAFFRYDPYRIGDVDISFGRQFYSVNSFDAYLNQLRISNYILNDFLNFSHRIELFNGFYVSTGFRYSARQSVEDYDRSTIINEVIDETDPLQFEDYEALITEARLSYTPQQKYMTEPNRKIILGSKFPTFSVAHRKGLPGPFSSDINFDYLETAIEQDIILGVFGNSKYKAIMGKFVNTRQLEFVDLKRFRQSDPYLYSDPLNSFQLLDTALVATDLFFEFHHIHHFNGALINNIPLVKKLRFRVVAGAGAMWIKQSDYFHQEIFAGLERVFKLGARRRLRVGVYGVAADSNQTPLATDFKISFDIIDTWKKTWS
ncbi:MAG: DUF5686 and carboxypeptidase regulatory-like domain-containing protein, partial [Bacteroidota bacterium]